MPKVQPPELKKFMDKKLSGKLLVQELLLDPEQKYFPGWEGRSACLDGYLRWYFTAFRASIRA